MKDGYSGLELSFLVGYSSKDTEGPIKTLTYTVEQWLNIHTGLITEISFSPRFYKQLTKEVGHPVIFVDTLIGRANVRVNKFQKEPVRIT